VTQEHLSTACDKPIFQQIPNSVGKDFAKTHDARTAAAVLIIGMLIMKASDQG